MDESLLPDKKHLKTYGVSTLDPKIDIADLTQFKQQTKNKIEKKVISRMKELKREYDKLAKEFDVNKMVLESQFSFEPVVGKEYYLYRRSDETTFLSLIEPDSWPEKQLQLMTAAKLTADGIWEEPGRVVR